MAIQDDVQEVRRAVAAVRRTTDVVLQHYGDTVDARRLFADVARLSDDLDLLCGAEPPPPPPAPPEPVREIISDSSYVHGFWMDAEDEGLGRSASPRSGR